MAFSKKSICFYQRGTRCDGDTPKRAPLGGTESAMLFMAAALARRGHQVRVFCEVDQAGIYDGVDYRHWNEFESFARAQEPDVLISIRALLPFLAGRWAKTQIYWAPDAFDQPFVNRAFALNLTIQGVTSEFGFYSLKVAEPFIDSHFCVGSWQAGTFQERFAVPVEKTFIAGNGVDFKAFLSPPLNHRKKQIVYCSTPFRGLSHLLEYFPEIKARVPEATCVVLSGMQLYGLTDDQDFAQFQSLYQKAKQPGVELLKPLPKPEMSRILSESRVFAYPNTFPETFCIAALEAQACGLPVVTTNLAGLKERVSHLEDGFLIDGKPSEGEYRSRFIDSVCRLLQDDSLWDEMSHQARIKAESFDYDRVAARWDEKFDELLNTPSKPLMPFIPDEEYGELLIEGKTKKIRFKKDWTIATYLGVLHQNGFAHTASQLEKDSVVSSIISKS